MAWPHSSETLAAFDRNGWPLCPKYAAKATFVKTAGIWKVYWMRGNLKWHPYDPATAPSLEAFLKLVHEDKHNCFFG